jgi:hypothetical protein
MSHKDSDKKWEDRTERVYASFSDHPVRTGVKWYFIALGIVISLAIVGGIVSYVGSWGSESKRVASPENVREQNTQIIEDYESLKAAASNACGVSTGAKSSDDPTLVENPALAYEATYRRIEVDYNRRMANLYEAQAVRKLPLPSNLRSYPEVAPTLKEMQAQVC